HAVVRATAGARPVADFGGIAESDSPIPPKLGNRTGGSPARRAGGAPDHEFGLQDVPGGLAVVARLAAEQLPRGTALLGVRLRDGRQSGRLRLGYVVEPGDRQL